MSAEREVAPADEVEDGDRRLIMVDGLEIAIFNVDGDFFAYNNWCAHQGGPACEGTVTGTMDASYDDEALELDLEYCKDGEILNCPWHGWEYDITSGECLSRRGVKLSQYPVRVEDGMIVVTI